MMTYTRFVAESFKAQKASKPEKVGSSWRIRRHDGELVGYYATKKLAQKAIDVAFYLK